MSQASETDRPLHEIVVYDPSRRVYLLPADVTELARASIPFLKGAVTRCDRTLAIIAAAAQRFGESPNLIRERKTIEAHRESAQSLLNRMRQVAEAE